MHSKIGQGSLFSNWIDGADIEPDDKQIILAYHLIENPDTELPLLSGSDLCYQGKVIFGPTVTTYNRELVNQGHIRKVAWWQPIEALP